jgi:hypothetical protein
VVEQVGVAFYLNFSVLIIGETIVAMNGDFHLKANSFEFFIEIFVGTDSIGFLSRIGCQIKFFRIWFYGSTCNKRNSSWNGSATHRLFIFRIP